MTERQVSSGPTDYLPNLGIAQVVSLCAMCEGIFCSPPSLAKKIRVQYKIIYFSDQDIVGNL